MMLGEHLGIFLAGVDRFSTIVVMSMEHEAAAGCDASDLEKRDFPKLRAVLEEMEAEAVADSRHLDEILGYPCEVNAAQEKYAQELEEQLGYK